MSTEDRISPTSARVPEADGASDVLKHGANVGDIIQSKGVTRMEAVYRETRANRKLLWLVGASVLVCAWAYSLDSSTNLTTAWMPHLTSNSTAPSWRPYQLPPAL